MFSHGNSLPNRKGHFEAFMIQLIQVAGGDVYTLFKPMREDAYLCRFARASWKKPLVFVERCVLRSFVEPEMGKPFVFQTIKHHKTPKVTRIAWQNEGEGSLEDALYALEWIDGFEQFFHRGLHANNPYPRGTVENVFWTKGFDNAVGQANHA